MSRRDTRLLRAMLAAALIAFAAKTLVIDVAVIEGRSMLPGLAPGSVVIVLRCAYGLRIPWGRRYLVRWSEPGSGDVVVAASPRDGGAVIKRVASIDDGYCSLRGDNPPESLDSRDYGTVSVEALRGKVLFLPAWPKP